jgi:hypothetical protein
MTEIHSVTIQIARRNDPGTIEQSHYFIEKGNVVVLCHRDGTPITREGLRVQRRRGEPPPLVRWERKLRPDEDHRRAARELLCRSTTPPSAAATSCGPWSIRPVVSSDRFRGTDLNQFHRTKTEFFVTP